VARTWNRRASDDVGIESQKNLRDQADKKESVVTPVYRTSSSSASSSTFGHSVFFIFFIIVIIVIVVIVVIVEGSSPNRWRAVELGETSEVVLPDPPKI